MRAKQGRKTGFGSKANSKATEQSKNGVGEKNKTEQGTRSMAQNRAGLKTAGHKTEQGLKQSRAQNKTEHKKSGATQ